MVIAGLWLVSGVVGGGGGGDSGRVVRSVKALVGGGLAELPSALAPLPSLGEGKCS